MDGYFYRKHIQEEVDMSSEEGGFGLTLAEKFFGFILVVIGIIAAYYTFTSADTLGTFTGFFGFLSILPIVIGIILVTAKIEQ
ncbi:MAG: hypothetical protein ACQXXE_00625 [Candidatus Bathyarchaeia archaeon]